GPAHQVAREVGVEDVVAAAEVGDHRAERPRRGPVQVALEVVLEVVVPTAQVDKDEVDGVAVHLPDQVALAEDLDDLAAGVAAVVNDHLVGGARAGNDENPAEDARRGAGYTPIFQGLHARAKTMRASTKLHGVSLLQNTFQFLVSFRWSGNGPVRSVPGPGCLCREPGPGETGKVENAAEGSPPRACGFS